MAASVPGRHPASRPKPVEPGGPAWDPGQRRLTKIPVSVLRGEQAVTPEMALRLGKLCGSGPDLWLRMQMARDLWRLERSRRAELAGIPTHRAA